MHMNPSQTVHQIISPGPAILVWNKLRGGASISTLSLGEGDAAQRNWIATQADVVNWNQHVPIKNHMLRWMPLQAHGEVCSGVSGRADCDRIQLIRHLTGCCSDCS